MSPLSPRTLSGRRSKYRARLSELARVVGLAALVGVLGGCDGAPPEPVGALSAEPATLQLAHGEARDLVLRFEPTAELGAGAEPFVFVHLVDTEGQVVLTADHALPGDWKPGEPLDDPVRLYHSALGPALPSGTYQMTVGLYQGDDRWALDAGEPVARQEYAVATVEVPEQGAALDATFSDAWMPVSLGTDRQVVARRWLGGEGHFEVAIGELPLALELQIPTSTEGQKLVLDEGASAAEVRVHASCSDVATTVTGSGRHRIDLPLTGAPEETSDTVAENDVVSETDAESQTGDAEDADSGEGSEGDAGTSSGDSNDRCRIAFEANYQLVDTQTFGTAVLSLEQLAWLVN